MIDCFITIDTLYIWFIRNDFKIKIVHLYLMLLYNRSLFFFFWMFRSPYLSYQVLIVYIIFNDGWLSSIHWHRLFNCSLLSHKLWLDVISFFFVRFVHGCIPLFKWFLCFKYLIECLNNKSLICFIY